MVFNTYFAHLFVGNESKDIMIEDITVYLENNTQESLVSSYNLLEQQIVRNIDSLSKIERGTRIIRKSDNVDVTEDERDRLKSDTEDNAILCYRIRVYINDLLLKSQTAVDPALEEVPAEKVEEKL
jgi:hypothetical protein